MSSRMCWRSASLTLLATLVLSANLMAIEPGGQAHMATFDKPTGETFFALSLSPTEKLKPAVGHDIVVLFDTSASQTGVYRDDALTALRASLQELGGEDRVQLLAIDLDAVELTEDFVPTNSPELAQAIDKLTKRLPLGSTNMLSALNGAIERFDTSQGRPRRVLYIGDGISRANILETREFTTVVRELIDRQISMVSLAIGPKRDVVLLSTLANHTGGHVYINTNKKSPADTGIALAGAVRAAVVWPRTFKLPETFAETYPALMPPLRSDRDSVLIGTLANRGEQAIEMTGTVNGRQVSWKWNVTAPQANEDFAHLPKLVDIARVDGGITLPTAGSAALMETQRVIMTGARDLSLMGEQALAHGDTAGAQTFAAAALANDPHNPHAKIVQNAARKRDADALRLAQAPDGDFLDGEVDTLPEGLILPPSDVSPGDVAPGDIVVESAPAFIDNAAPPERPDGELLGQIEARRQAAQDALRVQVRTALRDARDTMSSDPDAAISDLKLLMEEIRQVTGIDGEVRTSLTNQIASALREGDRRRVAKDLQDAAAAENLAIARERQRLLQSLARDETRVKNIIDRFDSLMREGNYAAAEESAMETRKIDPRGVVPEIAVLNARHLGYATRIHEIRERRHRMFFETMLSVEESLIPFPDEPPLVYPDAEFWEELTNRRKKYQDFDLSGTGGAEEKILQQLEEETTFDFFETPLEEVVSEISDRHNINVVLNNQALDELAIDSSEQITKELSGISLRSALRLTLREYDLTYVIRDEVLLITTVDDAETELITKVYSVGDLVMPIQSGIGSPFALGGGGGGGGGFGGGGGGGFGGGGGGFGGGGGGFGGGGGGFGGGGGGFGGGGFFQVPPNPLRRNNFRAFAVEDKLSLRDGNNEAESNVTSKTVARIEQPHAIAVDETAGITSQQRWNSYFARQRQLPTTERVSAKDIRETVRQLMKDQKPAETAAFIHAALANGFPQPWMYEALALALELSGAPSTEIERALMSAVDFSESVDDIFHVATYMSRNGLEKRALQLFYEVAAANPTRPEPYTLALNTAQRINDQHALRWASVGILRQAWPQGQEKLRLRAIGVAKQTYQALKQSGDDEAAKQLRDEINQALVRDCVAKVTWTGDADVDILVEEPSETICSLQNPRTTAGGVMLGDTSAASAEGEAITESYVCPEGFSGRYRLLIRPVWGEVTAGKVNVEITVAKGTDAEQTIRRQIPLADKPSMVVFEVPGRRQEPLADHQVATVAKRLEVNRTVLAQQLNQSTSPDVAADFALDRILAANGVIPRIRGAVGFQPVITQIPEGTSMSGTAVISADRRYVRISPSPFFSGIGDIFTFNFATGQNTPIGGGGGGGGGATPF